MIVSAIDAEPERACASAIVAGSVFPPGAVASPTVAAKLNVPSPAEASPCVPSSKRLCPAAPPIAVRSAVTVTPVLAGFVPGVTATVRSVDPPGATLAGLAAPTPLGFVAALQKCSALAEVRGLAAAAAKFAALSSVSVQPSFARKIAFVVLGAGAAPLPSKQLAVDP